MKHLLNLRVIALVFSLGLILSSATIADQNKTLSLDEVLQRLQTRHETLTTCITEFEQVQQNDLFAAPQESAGTLVFDRVGKLLINMRQPEPFVVLLSDGKIISGIPGSPLHQKTMPGGKTFLQKMLDLVRSADQLKKQFRIRMNHNPDETFVTLELIPLKMNRRMPFSKIQAEIDSHLWLPLTIQLLESGGDSTRFTFQFTTINLPLPKGIFNIGPIKTDASPSNDFHENK